MPGLLSLESDATTVVVKEQMQAAIPRITVRLFTSVRFMVFSFLCDVTVLT
jgi:hypothetical protein